MARRQRAFRRARGFVLVVACAFALAAAPADAAKVSLKQINLGPRAAERGFAPYVLVFQAGKGEANRVSVDGGSETIVTDKGAKLKAGARCDRLSNHRARCDFPTMIRIARLNVAVPARANLGSGNDRIEGNGIFWNRLNGGPGDDVLRGSPGNDLIIGGTGSDLIDGRGADQDVASYQGRSDDLRISLAKSTARNDGGKRDGPRGSRDRIVRVENAVGGKGDDVLRGTNGPDGLIPLAGEDSVFALAGDDFIDLGLEANGGGPADGQADAVNCGPGLADSVQGADGQDTLTDCE